MPFEQVPSIALSPANKGVPGLGILKKKKKKNKTVNPIASTGPARGISSKVNGKPETRLRLPIDLKAPSPTGYMLGQG